MDLKAGSVDHIYSVIHPQTSEKTPQTINMQNAERNGIRDGNMYVKSQSLQLEKPSTLEIVVVVFRQSYLTCSVFTVK